MWVPQIPRRFLIPLLVILTLVLSTLIYVYFTLSRTHTEPEVKTKDFKHLFSIYGYGKRSSQLLSRPNGIAVEKNGNIYLTDQENDRVLVFDKKGQFLFKFGKKGSNKGEFKAPMGIAISPSNQVFVTDRVQNKVLIFSSTGKFVKEFKVKIPLTPTVKNNQLYLTTYQGITIFDLKGKQQNKLGKKGRGKNEFDFPNGIAVDKDGTMYIADSNNIRIQALDAKGKSLWTVGEPPKDSKDRSRRFGLPVSIAIDENNLLYVVDAFPGSILVYSKKGEELAELGEYGTEEGQLNHPAQIIYAGNRVFYIADKYNDRVQAIRIPSFSQ